MAWVGALLVVVAGAAIVLFCYPVARWQRKQFERWHRGFPPWHFRTTSLRTQALCLAALGLGCLVVELLSLFGRL